MKSILFLDCDGTIREPISNNKFISAPCDQQIISGADVAIDYYHQLGYTIIGISNQGGVAAGHKTLVDTITEQRYTLQLFPFMEAIYFCPDFEGDVAWKVTRESAVNYPRGHVRFRKPNPGMIFLAIKEIAETIDYKISSDCKYQMVGDRAEDEQCAEAAGINFTPADLWLDCYRALKMEYDETGNIA